MPTVDPSVCERSCPTGRVNRLRYVQRVDQGDPVVKVQQVRPMHKVQAHRHQPQPPRLPLLLPSPLVRTNPMQLAVTELLHQRVANQR